MAAKKDKSVPAPAPAPAQEPKAAAACTVCGAVTVDLVNGVCGNCRG